MFNHPQNPKAQGRLLATLCVQLSLKMQHKILFAAIVTPEEVCETQTQGSAGFTGALGALG